MRKNKITHIEIEGTLDNPKVVSIKGIITSEKPIIELDKLAYNQILIDLGIDRYK